MKRVRSVVSALILGFLVFISIWLVAARLERQDETLRDIKAILAKVEIIAADQATTLEELRAAVAAGRVNTRAAIEELVRAMERDHDELLRAIRNDNDTIIRINTPARKSGEGKPSPTPTRSSLLPPLLSGDGCRPHPLPIPIIRLGRPC